MLLFWKQSAAYCLITIRIQNRRLLRARAAKRAHFPLDGQRLCTAVERECGCFPSPCPRRSMQVLLLQLRLLHFSLILAPKPGIYFILLFLSLQFDINSILLLKQTGTSFPLFLILSLIFLCQLFFSLTDFFSQCPDHIPYLIALMVCPIISPTRSACSL